MSSEPVIRIQGVGKMFPLYARPSDRLLQFFLPALQKVTGLPQRELYRSFWALKDISFEVRKGETLAIIGRNGSGKSTLLQIICGTSTQTLGSVAVSGRIAALLELGAGFNPEFSGRDNVFMNAALLGLSSDVIAARFHDIEAFAEIGEFIDQPVRTYSSGMFVRLAFATAIHCTPEVLVIDEALAVGDFPFQQRCHQFMRRELGGVTKLLVTHDMGAVSTMADRAVVLHQGRIIYNGGPQEAIEAYQIACRREDLAAPARGATRGSAGTSTPVRSEAAASANDWVGIPADRLSGALRAKITRCNWHVGASPRAPHISDGDLIRIDFEIECDIQLAEPIVGYQVQDRFGTVVFGQNSHDSPRALTSVATGTSRGSLHFSWPEIAPGKYSITLGLADGAHSHHHVIQCWAHNIITFDSTARRPVHGIFNQGLTHVHLE